MRIISLCPSITDIILHIGGKEMLCGVTDHCPEIPGVMRLGSPKALKFSEIEKLSPDLILADKGDNRPEELRPLQQKFKVEILEVRSLQEVLDAVAVIGRSIQKIEGASKLNEEIGRTISETRARATGKTPLRTLILLWNMPFLTVNFNTYPSRLIETCGATNVFHQDPVYEIPIELEDMIEKEPQLLLLASEPYPFKKQQLKKFREYQIFSRIPLELVDGYYFCRYGPMTIEALKFFEALIQKLSVIPAKAGIHENEA